MPLGPKIMLREEKVEELYPVRHSVRFPQLYPEITRFDITHAQVEIDSIFLQILKALSID